MKVIIPLAGFGTRLRPHTFTRPKPLVTVAGKPVLGHLLDKLSILPIDEYIFIVGYLGDQIEDYVKTEYNIPARFVEQREMLGQAHAIFIAREFVDDSPAFVIFADTLFETDLSKLPQTTDDARIFVKEIDDPRPYGVVSLNSERYITKFVEKPSTIDNKLVVVGMYYFKNGAQLMSAIERLIDRKKMTKNEYFLADAMEIMVAEDNLKFSTQEIEAWLDCGNAENVLATSRYLLEHGHDNSTEFHARKDVIIIPPVNIHPSATVTNSIIGPHVTIAAGCTISTSLLRNSIMDRGAVVNETMLEDSIVGRNARVEDHARMVNVGDSSAIGFVNK